MQSSKQSNRLVFIASGVMGFVTALFFAQYAGPDISVVIAIVLTLYLAVFVGVVFIISGALWLWRKWTWAKRINFGSMVIGLFMLVYSLSAVVVSSLAPNSVENVKASCEKLVPYLDDYYTAQGQYPATLTALDEFSPLPDDRLTSCEYFGKTETFSIITSDVWLGYWSYDSGTREWVYVD